MEGEIGVGRGGVEWSEVVYGGWSNLGRGVTIILIVYKSHSLPQSQPPPPPSPLLLDFKSPCYIACMQGMAMASYRSKYTWISWGQIRDSKICIFEGELGLGCYSSNDLMFESSEVWHSLSRDVLCLSGDTYCAGPGRWAEPLSCLFSHWHSSEERWGDELSGEGEEVSWYVWVHTCINVRACLSTYLLYMCIWYKCMCTLHVCEYIVYRYIFHSGLIMKYYFLKWFATLKSLLSCCLTFHTNSHLSFPVAWLRSGQMWVSLLDLCPRCGICLRPALSPVHCSSPVPSQGAIHLLICGITTTQEGNSFFNKW